MTNGWVGTGYSGGTNIRLADQRLLRAFVILHRDPEVPEGGDVTELDYSLDEKYQAWWGYVRYEPGEADPAITDPDFDEPLTIVADERVGPWANRGWPGDPLRVAVIRSHRRGRGFEALVRELWEADA